MGLFAEPLTKEEMYLNYLNGNGGLDNLPNPLTPIQKYLYNLCINGGMGNIAGEIKMWPNSLAPNGFYNCDGSEKNRITDAKLFSIIGVLYGIGNGSTTFNLPNFNGKVPVGIDTTQPEFNTIGKTGGEKNHVLTTTEIPNHNHANGSYSKLLKVDGGGTTGMTDNSGGEPNLNSTGTIATVGGDGAHNNLQPYIVLNYIIKY